MKDTIHIQDKGDFLLDLPHICPFCNQGIKPVALTAISSEIVKHLYTENKTIETIEILFKCAVCEKIFWAEYWYIEKFSQWALTSINPPNENLSIDLPKAIGKMYPDFYEIYTQAAKAESEKLNRICGLGYRKAIEFLVKEYAIRKYPKEEETIKTETLGNTISKRIDNSKIKDLAKLISWLGNDHAHIVNKHPDIDIEKMKAFISALVAFITYENRAEEAAKIVGN